MDVPASAARAWPARRRPRQAASADPPWPCTAAPRRGTQPRPRRHSGRRHARPRASRARRPPWPPCRAAIRARRRDHGSRHRLGGTAGGEEDRAPVGAELPRGASAEASRRQHDVRFLRRPPMICSRECRTAAPGRPRSRSRSSHEPPCGLPYSATRAPAGSSPAAATRPTASTACQTRAVGSALRQFLAWKGLEVRVVTGSGRASGHPWREAPDVPIRQSYLLIARKPQK